MSNVDSYMNHFCPVCRADRHRPIAVGSLVECEDCQFVFVKEVPSLVELRARQSPAASKCGGSFHPQRCLTRRFKYWAFSKVVEYCCRKQPVIHTLQLGCNEGLFLEMVEQNRRFCSTGLDWREQPVEYALTKGYDAHLTDWQKLKYPDETFDFVFGLHPVETLQNPEQFMLELFRVLKPGGFLLTVMPGQKRSRQNRVSFSENQLWSFTPLTLSRFAERFKFRALKTFAFPLREEVCLFARKEKAADLSLIPRWMGTPLHANPSHKAA